MGFATVLTLSNSAIAEASPSATQVGALELGMTWENLRKVMRVPDAAGMLSAILATPRNELRKKAWGVDSASLVSAGAVIYLRPNKDVCAKLVKRQLRGVKACLLTFGQSTANTPYRLVDLSVVAGGGLSAFVDAKKRYSADLGDAATSTNQSAHWNAQVFNNRVRVYLYDHRPGFRVNLNLRDAYAGAISHGRRLSRMRKGAYMVGGYAPPPR